MQQRFHYVDWMKCIGIFLVVFGHSPSLSDFTTQLIFSFHMPLFFFVSGLLFDSKNLSLSIFSFIKKNCYSLIVPYFVFFILSYGYWIAKENSGHTAAQGIAWFYPFLGFLYGTGDKIIVNIVLWFFTCLFSVKFIYYAFAKKINSNLMLLLSCLLSFFYIYLIKPNQVERFFWNFDISLVAIFFFSLGKVFGDYKESIFKINLFMKVILVCVFFVLWFFLAKSNGRVDFNNLIFGDSFLITIVASTSILLALIILCSTLPGNSFAEFFSIKSLFIFPLHYLFFRIFTGLLLIFFGIPNPFSTNEYYWVILYPLFGLICCYIFILFTPRKFYFLFGR